MSRIMSSSTWTLCMRRFTNTHLRAWSNATVFRNRFAHTFSKGDNDKVIQALELEDVNMAEKRSNGATMRGDSQVFSTAAVKSGKSPKSPGANTGRDPQTNSLPHFAVQEEHKSK